MAGTVVEELIALLGYEIKDDGTVQKFEGQLKGLEKRVEGIGLAIGTGMMVAGAAVAAGLGFLGKGVIDTNAQFETYLATLETIEGSADKAKGAFDWIANFAATTPFEVDELTRSFVKLRSYGLDPMDGSMKVMGDTASGMGRSIDQVVEAVADAATFQFERLRELGIVASQKGDEVAFSWTENGKAMSKSVKKTSAEVTKLLYDVWGKKFNGAMLRQSKTWKGMMSNLSDSWTMFLYKIGQSGFFDTVKGKLGEVADIVGGWMTDGTAERVAKTLGALFTGVANVVGAVSRQIAAHIAFIVKNWARLAPYVKATAIAFGVLMAAARPVLTILTLIAFAVDDFLTWMEGGDSVIGRFANKLKELFGISDSLADTLAGLSAVIATGLLAAFAAAPLKLIGLGGRLAFALIGLIGPALVAGLTTLGAAGGAIVQGLLAAFAFLATPAGWAIILAGIAAALVAYFWDDLVSLWNGLDFASLGAKIAEGIATGVRAAGGAVTAAIDALIPDSIQVPITDQAQTHNSNVQGADAGAKIGAWGGKGIKNRQSGHGLIDNFERNAGKTSGQSATTAITNDNSNRSQTNNNTVTIHQNVQQATQAPAAAASATASAVSGALAPSRAQDSGVQ